MPLKPFHDLNPLYLLNCKIMISLLNYKIYSLRGMQQLRDKRREKRAAELMQQDDEAIVKLENAAIEHSKSVDSSVLGKYSIWRKENENDNSDSTVRLMRDQMIMARVYLSIAKMKNKLDLQQELQTRLKESQRALADATADADLHRR